MAEKSYYLFSSVLCIEMASKQSPVCEVYDYLSSMALLQGLILICGCFESNSAYFIMGTNTKFL